LTGYSLERRWRSHIYDELLTTIADVFN